ncbi:MAG: T9SS type A sorting domain-containing protein [Candidatus Kapaibacterium sp.]
MAAMTCRVSGATGAIICSRTAAALAPADEHGELIPRLTAAPNPASGRVSVLVELPGDRSGDISVALYDVAGRLLLHPVTSARSGREYTVELDLARLPAGRYYCRARCAGWVGSVAIVW